MTLEEFIGSNPSNDQIAFQICGVANMNVLNIDETYAWDSLSKLGRFVRDDFYDDTEETIVRFGREAIDVYGITNWKLKSK